MIPAFIVLAVVACALGGVIAFTEIHSRKTATPQPETAATIDEESAANEDNPTRRTDEPPTETETENNSVGRGFTSRRADETLTAPRKIAVRYSKSFLAKLIQSDDQTKRYYSALKNRLLAYGGVQSHIGWRWESFRAGRKTLARLRLRGKTLSLCLALDPEAYGDPKYHTENLSSVKAYKTTPCMCRIKSDKRLTRGEELIDALMEEIKIPFSPQEEIDYVTQYPYEAADLLVSRGLIKSN